MGQKVNPFGFRLGTVNTWRSRWFAPKSDLYAKQLLEDHKMRKFLMDKLKPAGIAKVEIERSFDKRTVYIFVSRPGVAIGRGGTGIEQLKAQMLKTLNLKVPDGPEALVIHQTSFGEKHVLILCGSV